MAEAPDKRTPLKGKIPSREQLNKEREELLRKTREPEALEREDEPKKVTIMTEDQQDYPITHTQEIPKTTINLQRTLEEQEDLPKGILRGQPSNQSAVSQRSFRSKPVEKRRRDESYTDQEDEYSEEPAQKKRKNGDAWSKESAFDFVYENIVKNAFHFSGIIFLFVLKTYGLKMLQDVSSKRDTILPNQSAMPPPTPLQGGNRTPSSLPVSVPKPITPAPRKTQPFTNGEMNFFM